jgi:hypothetical protein
MRRLGFTRRFGLPRYGRSSGLFAALLALGTGFGALAQEGSIQGNLDVSPSAAERSTLGFGEGSFIAVPIPFNNPTFGAGLALGAGYLFQQDAGSATSFLGIGGFKTSNGSFGYGAALDLSLGEGRWHGSLFVGEIDLTYDLFVLGIPVPINQSGQAVRGEFRYGFFPSLSAGISFRYLQTELEGIGGGSLPSQISDALKVELGSLGLVANWDSTNSTYYPTTGLRASLDLTYTESLTGIPRSYGKAVAKGAAYFPLGESIVVAGTLVGCSAADEAPFYDSCLLGGTDSFRGYPVMEYFGNELVSAQAEIRGTVGERFGYVAFAGAGTVSESLIAATDGVVVAGGLGLRYRVSKEFGLDLSLDASVNEDSETLVYLYVGQRF